MIRGIAADDHDRGTGAPDRDARLGIMKGVDAGNAGSAAGGAGSAVLEAALEQLRLEGAIFFRSELTDAFAFESTPLAFADSFHAGADRLILFHIVAAGSCWVEVGGERHWARQGDVIVLPYGDQHVIGGLTPAVARPIHELMEPPPWKQLPLLRHGGGGARTDIVCGYLYSEDPLFDPAMRALPPVFLVKVPEGPASGWVQASIEFAVAESERRADEPPVRSATRLPELVLIEVLRVHLASAPAVDRGWVSALRDPVLAPSLALLHSDPARRWTVADLASGAAVSRSLLDARFREVLGRSPIRYLTEWRMHLADDLLATTDLGVVAIAHKVGYDSEEAFSRAFKREHGLSPTHWREARGIT
jgi:AraC-like DNA-binding protein